jgi:hypothetical protein
MSAISTAKDNYDDVLAKYNANPPTKTLADVMTALNGLIAAIKGTTPAPTQNPDRTTYESLDAYQSVLVAYQLEAAQAGQISALQTSVSAMQPADSYESADVASSTTAGVKHYQIWVPNFAEGSSPGPTFPNLVTVSSGTPPVPKLSNASSFLRLGSPPDPTNDWSTSPFQNSVNLARLVGDPWVICAAENMTLTQSGSTVSTTVTDSSTASSVVPSSTAAAQGTANAASATGWTSNFADGSGNPSITSDDAYTFGALYAVGDGTKFGNAFNTNQDASYFPGFADDTRQRGTPAQSQAAGANTTCPATTNVSNATYDNLPWNRQAETLKLLTKGGWWDHSDGNRVTTTSGDKIEVIGGNYKLVVLGRQTVPTPPPASSPTSQQVDDYRKQLVGLAGNAFITDVSGGHFQEQYPSPTPCIKTIEYVQDAQGEWTLYQDNGLGNLVTKLKGRTVDLFQGPSRETYVGNSSPKLLWTNGASSSSGSADQTKPSTALGSATTSDVRLDPMIASYTWAQSVYSQTGSETKPVGGMASDNPSPSDTTGPQPSKVCSNPTIAVGNGDVVSATWANRVATYVGSSAQKVPTVYSETNANNVKSVTNVGATTVYSEINDGGLGNIVNMTKAGSITSLTAAFHIMDMSIALRTTIAVGLARDVYLLGKFTFNAGVFTEVRVGPKFEINSSTADTMTFGEAFTCAGDYACFAAMVLLGV